MAKLKLMILALFCVFSSTTAFAGSVVAPYWQYDASTYTFVGISNPSTNSQNVTVAATLGSGASLGSTTFTVAASTTQRVFIVITNHATINPTNITDAKFIAGTTTNGIAYGQLMIDGSVNAAKLIYQGGIILQGNTGFTMGFSNL